MLSFDKLTVAYDGMAPSLKQFSLDVKAGEIVALVGESGSGKTTTIRAAMGLLPFGGEITEGDIRFDGQSLVTLEPLQYRTIRGRQMAMIFQDSGSMLNPIRRIGSQFTEYIRTHMPMAKKDAFVMGSEMLKRMGLPHSDAVMKSYPFQLSGGMRQRVGIAMAMVFQPQILLADEPTSALDVTTQAQIVRQMMNLREEYGTSILLVTHNLGVAAYMADQILVMKDGLVVDRGDRDYIINHSDSEYTRTLLAAVPQMKGERYV